MIGRFWQPHQVYWKQAFSKIQGDERISPVAGAKLVANRIVAGNLTAPQLVLLASHELSPEWHRSEDLYNALGNLIDKLRDRRLALADRLAALAEFRRILQPDRWQMVENAILQQYFAWPLLILSAQGKRLEFSLPVAVDLSLSSQAPLDVFQSDGVISTGEWEEPLRNALCAALDLWDNKHLAWPPTFREALSGVWASVDVRAAEAAVAPFLTFGKFELSGRSAEAYLALTLLAHLIDPSALETTCATGILGKTRPDREGGGDRFMDEPRDLDLKFRYASDTQLFDSYIVPEPAKGIETKGHLRVQKGGDAIRFREPRLSAKVAQASVCSLSGPCSCISSRGERRQMRSACARRRGREYTFETTPEQLQSCVRTPGR